jgi:hypothetical protein
MVPNTPETIEGFHSKDFRIDFADIAAPPKIAGLTQAEWETRFESVGAIEHLKELGWSNYQWRYTSPEQIAKNELAFGYKLGCFAEFFSPYYHGYLRGDGDTLNAAIMACLNRAQKMAECEIRTHHQYKVRPMQGYVTCELCGFNGFSPQVQTLRQSNDNLQSHIKFLQGQAIRFEEAIYKAGMRWSLKDFMETLEIIPEVKKESE